MASKLAMMMGKRATLSGRMEALLKSAENAGLTELGPKEQAEFDKLKAELDPLKDQISAEECVTDLRVRTLLRTLYVAESDARRRNGVDAGQEPAGESWRLEVLRDVRQKFHGWFSISE